MPEIWTRSQTTVLCLFILLISSESSRTNELQNLSIDDTCGVASWLCQYGINERAIGGGTSE